MPTLHLGTAVVPYQTYSKGQTTYDVAMILEAKYGIMKAFWNTHGQDVVDNMTKDFGKSVEALMRGERAVPDFSASMSECQHMFRTFISSREAEAVGIPGTPTQAALRGVSHRRRHPYQRSNPRRPSFRDTGLYEASFRAWVTG